MNSSKYVTIMIDTFENIKKNIVTIDQLQYVQNTAGLILTMGYV